MLEQQYEQEQQLTQEENKIVDWFKGISHRKKMDFLSKINIINETKEDFSKSEKRLQLPNLPTNNKVEIAEYYLGLLFCLSEEFKSQVFNAINDEMKESEKAVALLAKMKSLKKAQTTDLPQIKTGRRLERRERRIYVRPDSN